MKDDFSVLIQNRTEFEKGNPATVFLSLPATKEELHEAMKALNITADNPQDFFLNGYSTADNRRIEIPFDWIRDGDIDRINYLAARLEEMTPEQLEKLDAVMHSDFKPESLDKLIDHTYNTDFYSYVPGILSYKELGGYFLNDSGKVQMPEEWKAGIDREDFGFNAALHENGKLTDYGYIARSGTDWKAVYAGQETPEKYRIMSYPEAERTAPEQDKKEAAPAVDITAANPIRPIELKSQKSTEKIKEITDRLEQGIQDLFDSDRFKEYLRVMSKFHDYSFNNTLLIAMQKPDATLVAGYTSWKKDYGRQVVSHAKSIKVLAPSPYKVKREVDKIDPQTQKPVIGKDGKPVKEETEITVPAFKVVSVFDVSQTEGKELPTIGVDELTGDVEQYADFFKATEQASPAPVGFEKIESGAKGYYSQTEKHIAINEGMSELQNLKTLIHEIAHAKLHDIDLNAPAKEQADRPDRRTREVQAESIAYAVCQHYGLDTSDYSFAYVAKWSSGRELSELKASLKTIRDTAAELIADIDKNFAELTQNREQTQAQEAQADEPTPEEKTEPTAEPPQEEKAGADEPAADTPKAETAAPEEPAKSEAQTEQPEDTFPTPDLGAEPVVTILWSEHGRFHDGESMSFSEANALIESLDRATVSEDGYYKTKFRIDFVMDGQPDNYIGRQDLGDGDGTLIDHIESYHAYYENNADWDNFVLHSGGTEALEADKAQREMLLHEFVPYLKLHNNLSQMEKIATKALEENSGMTATETAYHTAMKDYVSKCRTMVNNGNYDLPPVPQLKDFDTELAAYKEHVKEEIAQEAAAAGMTVEEYAANGYEPYAAGLPDPSITVSDMQEYGYSWDGMLPLKEETALHLYDKEDMQIFLLHEDGSESIPDSTEDIKAHAEKGGIFGVHKEDWNALTEYRAMKEELAAGAPEKEMRLLYGKEDAFGIYQLKDGDGMRDYHFEPYDRLQAAGLSVDPANYDLIYTAPLAPDMTLEDISIRFNIDHPADFKGHSLSTSDVVVLHQNGQNTAYYADSIGYREVPEFLREQKQLTPDELTTGEQITTPRGSFHVTAMSREQMKAAGYGVHHQSEDGKYYIMGNGTQAFAVAVEQPENYLKAAELSTEQNANMIDGVINNTPNTDALEAKANAGEQISLADLADAIQKDREAAHTEPDTARITAAAKSRYDGMVALFTMDDKIYIGKSEHYDNKGHYDNKDNSLLYVTDCQAAFTFLSSEGCTYPQDEALNRGIYTKEEYEEFSRITDFLSQAGFTPEKEFFFADKPFSLQADTPEQAAPETKTIYYTINEGAARRANDMNSFSDYKPGSATAEYRQMVDKAVEIGERQKKRVDPMYHEKIDSLVDTYARKLAENMNSSFSIEARVPSILIAGGSNFPVRKKEKQNAARDRNMEDWNEIQGLLDKIRSTGMGGISADDPQAIQKLEAKLEKLQAAQDTMKAVNAYYRKHKTLDGCPNLSAERIEAMKGEMSSQWHIEDKPYPSWALSNNNAEIRRIKGRIAELTKKQETAYAGWEFDGGTVEMNREDNRLQIFFEEKPDEQTRETLKESGFRWSPKAGAWQRQLNDNAIYAADRLSCIKPLSGKSPVEIQKEARTAAKTEKKPSIRAQLAQDKEALKNAPKKATEKSKKQDLERS